MKLIILIGILVAVAVGPSRASAQSDGTGGGGALALIRGVPRLSDLFDHCKWRRFSTLMGPEGEKILKSIEVIHWPFAEAIRTEMNELRVCLTPNGLKSKQIEEQIQNASDPQAFFISRNPAIHAIAAIRVGDRVFWDTQTVSSMPVMMDRTLLVFHEIFHSFIEVDGHEPDSNYYLRLRSLTNAMGDHYRTPMNADGFSLQLSEARTSVPIDISEGVKNNEKDLKLWIQYSRSRLQDGLVRLPDESTALNESIARILVLPIFREKFEFSFAPRLASQMVDLLDQYYDRGFAKLVSALQEKRWNDFSHRVFIQRFPVEIDDRHSILDAIFNSSLSLMNQEKAVRYLLQSGRLNSSQYKRVFLFLIDYERQTQVRVSELFEVFQKAFKGNDDESQLIETVIELSKTEPIWARLLFAHPNYEDQQNYFLFNLILEKRGPFQTWWNEFIQTRTTIDFDEDYLGFRLAKATFDFNDIDAFKSVQAEKWNKVPLRSPIGVSLFDYLFAKYLRDPRLDLSFLEVWLRSPLVDVNDGVGVALRSNRPDLVRVLVNHPTFNSDSVSRYWEALSTNSLKDFLKGLIQKQNLPLLRATFIAVKIDTLTIRSLIVQNQIFPNNPEVDQFLNQQLVIGGGK